MSKTYLTNFFEEKQINYTMFEVLDQNNLTHFIDTDFVITAILNAPLKEQLVISQTLRKIDYYNKSVVDYLRFLAEILVKKFETSGQKTSV